MKTLLWLDDIRNPKISDWLLTYAPKYAYGEGEVVWVKNYNEFVSWIEENGLPDMICFDHDLAEEKSGYDCAKWLVEYCMDNNLPVPKFNIQSANPSGKINIKSLLDNYQGFYERQNKDDHNNPDI